MSVRRAAPETSSSALSVHSFSSLARWAVRLAAGVVVVNVVSGAILGVAYAIGGPTAIEDNWVGFLTAVSVLGGLAVSLAAFVLAIAARARGERLALLWLPLLVFPALLMFVVLGEAFWWE